MPRWPAGYQPKPRKARVFASVPPEHRASVEEVAAIVGVSVTRLIDLASEFPCHRRGVDLPMPEHIGYGAWVWDRRRVQEWKNQRTHEHA